MRFPILRSRSTSTSPTTASRLPTHRPPLTSNAMWLRPLNFVAITAIAALCALAIFYDRQDIGPEVESVEYSVEWPVSKAEFNAAITAASVLLKDAEIIIKVSSISATEIQFKTRTCHEAITNTSSQSSGRIIIAKKTSTAWACTTGPTWHRSSDH